MITETLCASDYRIICIRKSRIDPEKTIIEDHGIYCPRCRKAIDSVGDHGTPFECPQCYMSMVVYGDGLECTIQEDDYGTE